MGQVAAHFLFVFSFGMLQASFWRSFPELAQLMSSAVGCSPGQGRKAVLQDRYGGKSPGHKLFSGGVWSVPCGEGRTSPYFCRLVRIYHLLLQGDLQTTTCREHPFNILLKERIYQRGKHSFIVFMKSFTNYFGLASALVSGGE